MIGGYLRSLPAGFTVLILSIGIIAIGAAVASLLANNMIIKLGSGGEPTLIASNTTTFTLSSEGNYTKLYVEINVSNTIYKMYILVNGTYDNPVNGNYDINGTYKVTIIPINFNATLGSTASTGGTYEFYIDDNSAPQTYIAVATISGGKQYVIVANGVISEIKVWDYSNASTASTIDLGFITGLAVVFAGLFMFMKGLRMLTRTRI